MFRLEWEWFVPRPGVPASGTGVRAEDRSGSSTRPCLRFLSRLAAWKFRDRVALVLSAVRGNKPSDDRIDRWVESVNEHVCWYCHLFVKRLANRSGNNSDHVSP